MQRSPSTLPQSEPAGPATSRRDYDRTNVSIPQWLQLTENPPSGLSGSAAAWDHGGHQIDLSQELLLSALCDAAGPISDTSTFVAAPAFVDGGILMPAASVMSEGEEDDEVHPLELYEHSLETVSSPQWE